MKTVNEQSAQRFLITGEVQGVGYRYFAQVAARRLGLVGTIRNLADGRVAVIAQGAATDLESFAQELSKGPPHAIIDKIETSPVPVKADRIKFEIVQGQHAFSP